MASKTTQFSYLTLAELTPYIERNVCEAILNGQNVIIRDAVAKNGQWLCLTNLHPTVRYYVDTIVEIRVDKTNTAKCECVDGQWFYVMPITIDGNKNTMFADMSLMGHSMVVKNYPAK